MVNASTPVTSSTSASAHAHTSPTSTTSSSSSSGSGSSNQDVINLQYMDLEEFLLENAVAVVQQHATSVNNANSSDSKGREIEKPQSLILFSTSKLFIISSIS